MQFANGVIIIIYPEKLTKSNLILIKNGKKFNLSLNSAKDAPCKNCAKRKQLCHETCKDYKNWAKEKDEINKKQRRQKVNISNGWGFIPRKKNE